MEILPPFVMMVVTAFAGGGEHRATGPVFESEQECRRAASDMRAEMSARWDGSYEMVTWFCGGTYSEATKWFDKGARVFVAYTNLTATHR